MKKILTSHGRTPAAAGHAPARTQGPSWPSSAARSWAQNIKAKDVVAIGPVLNDGSESIGFTPDGAAKAKKLIAIFGFDRLPATAAELQQLLAYCRALDGTLPPRVGRESIEQQRARALGNDEGRQYALAWVQSHWPAAKDAVSLFAAADIQALRQLHARLDLMTAFGTGPRA
jgi:hypothetical protein